MTSTYHHNRTYIACLEADRLRSATLTENEWASMFERFRAPIARIARSYGLNAHDVDDVCQQAWLRLLQHRGSIRDPRALPGWLATTTRRESLRARGRTRREQLTEHELDREDGAVEDFDDVVVAGDRRAAVRDALKSLPPHQRRLMELMLDEPQLSYAEIAERLGVSIGSVGPTRMRCVERLRDELAPRAAVLAHEAA